MFPNLFRAISGLRISAACALACLSLLTVVTAQYGHAEEEEKPKNLQVLDSTVSHDSLLTLMDNFTVALHVRCGYCHAHTGDSTSHDMDWASDKMPAKLTTREMMRLTNTINNQYLAKMKGLDTPLVSVQCVTCHRGQPRPVLIQDILKQSFANGGYHVLDSAYRDLRTRYYGTHTFDFSDYVLVQVAMEISEESDSSALQILTLNREFNLKSAFNEWATGQIYAELKDTAAAIQSLERALAINPKYQRAIRGLESLRRK